ncbi:hypothetical protein LCGC14_1882870 [marine sediment metagenome]|uniref:Uncharacterized protein n=1 Tax=marine sediment metagenome TaxID=412755 RepID=A0A0F9IFN6_9ZZZZ
MADVQEIDDAIVAIVKALERTRSVRDRQLFGDGRTDLNFIADRLDVALSKLIHRSAMDSVRMTATEVLERRSEFLRAVEPTFGKVQ